MNIREKIEAKCDSIKAMLLAKNEAYGNSALEPLRICSTASKREQLWVREDDKLSRIRNARANGVKDTEDAILDLVGYFILDLIAEDEEKESIAIPLVDIREREPVANSDKVAMREFGEFTVLSDPGGENTLQCKQCQHFTSSLVMGKCNSCCVRGSEWELCEEVGAECA